MRPVKFLAAFLSAKADQARKKPLPRLIDRPIRPLFPNGFKNEVQVVCTVISAEKDIDPDIASMIGTSAALAISGIPFNGPVGAARVGYTEDEGYLLNPNYSDLEASLVGYGCCWYQRCGFDG